jgi:hypothetical protein
MEERKVYYTSRPAPGYLQNSTGPKIRVVEVFILRKVAASKQGVQKQTWQLAVQGYNISFQRSCGKRSSTVSNEIAGCRGSSYETGFYSSLVLFQVLIFL